MDFVIGAGILLVGVLTGAAIVQPSTRKIFKSYKDADEYIREEENNA